VNRHRRNDIRRTVIRRIDIFPAKTSDNQSHNKLQMFENFVTLKSGDTIPKEDTQQILRELADPEDEDGFFPYTGFVDRLCGKA